MGYKYITDNNLYEKQTYMYSEYRGIDFLKGYLDSRNTCLKMSKKTEKNKNKKIVYSSVYNDLVELNKKLKSRKRNKEAIWLVDTYIKSFEVRKRIYTEYDANGKPVDSAGFEEYESYLVLAECLLLAYGYTKCLKYFNCLLKLDDTLISIQNRMEQQYQEQLCQILKQELNIFNQLVVANGISGGSL